MNIATGTMGYKHRKADLDKVLASLKRPSFLLKIIPPCRWQPAHP